MNPDHTATILARFDEHDRWVTTATGTYKIILRRGIIRWHVELRDLYTNDNGPSVAHASFWRRSNATRWFHYGETATP